MHGLVYKNAEKERIFSMKLKKILALVVVAIMLCTVVVSVGAASYDYDQQTIYDVNTGKEAAKARYYLNYYSYTNCVRATNAITYYSNVHVSQCNFPGYISLKVVTSGGTWTAETAEYLHVTSDTPSNYKYAEFYSDFYIPAGCVLTSASAYYSTNDDNMVSSGYYVNYNYDWVETSADLVVTP